jgi:signal transduction histidine kinase/ligand-binding sensor domain-containing protein/DNA-binding response OmpR family regulator
MVLKQKAIFSKSDIFYSVNPDASGWKLLFFTSAFFLVAFCSIAQPSKLAKRNIDLIKLPEALGLSQSSINCILQDRDGYLWIATWSGLIRYDGYSTTIFHSGSAPGSIKSNLISTVYEDRIGNIWVGTHMGGLFEYNKETNQFINYKHDDHSANCISSNNIWKIIEDDLGNLWIATENGLNFLDPRKKVFISYINDPQDSSSLSGDFVTDVFFSKDKVLWIATNKGVNKLLKSSAQYHFERYYNVKGDAADNFAYTLDEVISKNKSTIWFITKKGLNKIEDGKLKNFTIEECNENSPLLRSMLKVKGEKPFLLLGSARGLTLFDFEEQKFTRSIANFDNRGVTMANESMYITALYIDRGGVLWVGTKTGLYKSDSYQKDFKLHLTSSFDKTNSIISGIEPAENKGYWISTLGGGLFKMIDDKFYHYKFSTSVKSYFVDFIQSLFKDSKGNIWVGTAGAGVFSFHPKDIRNAIITKFNHYHTKSSPAINDDYIVSFTEDRRGSIWIGTWSGGLIKIDDKGEIIQYTDKLFAKAPLVVMHADADTLWIGTRGNGIYRINTARDQLETKHYFQAPDSVSLCNDFINDIYEDHSGNLWIGTEGGLMRFDKRSERFRYQSIEDGPSIKVIVGILEDGDGKLWLSHWGGITVLDIAKNKQPNVKNFDQHDRIQGGFYFNNVCYKDADGNLLFGGSNGLNIINPQDIIQNPLSPNIQFTQLKLFNNPVSQHELVDNRVLLERPLNEINGVTLHHNENAISFEFAALDFAAPEKIRYAYTLEGFDKDWNYTDASRRYANYTNLNPGHYVFKVKAMNNDGLWSNNIKSLNIEIKLPWWETRWAMWGYWVLSILAFFVLYKLLMMRTNFIHALKIERLQRESMENLNKAKLHFFTNISHELRTPLTLILGPVQSLIESNKGGELAHDYLMRINNNAQRLLHLVNQLLDFRKIETGNLKLEIAEANMVAFINEIKLSFESLAEKRKIDFTFHYGANVIIAWFDADQFEKILYNLLSNAFKNTSEGSKISITLTETDDNVLIIIADKGKGIKPENLERIFQPFFSYSEDRHHDSTGIGLALVKSLLDAHHGTIKVESIEDVSTRFILSIPKGNSHFDPAEVTVLHGKTGNVADYMPVVSERQLDFLNEQEPADIKTRDLAKILVVEDNEEVRGYIKQIFIKYLVLESANGKDGLEVAMEENPDIIISDVMMPLMDGIAFCKALKSNLATSHIPVILLTARTSLTFEVEGLETGADDYISKPFSPKVLQLKVRNLLQSRTAFKNMFLDQKILHIEPKRVTLNSTDEKFIHQILESVEKNIGNADYSVETLNGEMGMSRTLLYKKLKSLTGQSPNEFIRTMRLKRAAQLLEQNELTIAEVTYEVGFNDLAYFRECFKKLFGVTPSEYGQRKSFNKLENQNDV